MPSEGAVSRAVSRDRPGDSPREDSGGSIRSLDAVSAENGNLKEKVVSMEEALEAKEARLRTIMGEVAALRKESERGKKSAKYKYDLAAREGQTKRLGILEHTVTTLRHDLGTNVERRQKVEEKMSILERSWQNERSLRLQDLHRHDAMSSSTKNAERAAEEAEGKWLAAEQKARMLQIELETRAREMQSQTRISEANESEIDAQATEIERHKTEILGLKKTLRARDGDISAECTRSSDLRRELSRVRRDFIVSTSNRTEQQNAFLGGRKKGNDAVRRRASSSSSTSLARDASAGACAPARMTSSSRDRSRQQPLSRLESSALQEARTQVSIDGVFLSKVDGLLVGRSSTFNSSSSGSDGYNGGSIERAHASRGTSSSSGCVNANIDRPDDSAESKHQNTTSKEGRARANPGSTLLVAGSLYVGTGLGFKNTPVWVPPGGSAKGKLKNIMGDKTNSCNQAPTIVHEIDEERD